MTPQQGYEFHEYANLFPMMSADELQILRQDMRENGYRDSLPIVLYDDKILDGRNRYTAALAEGIEPVYAYYPGSDPLAYVISTNLHRRHLTVGQQSMIAAKMATMKRGRPETNRSKELFVSQLEAAEMMGVSEPSVKRAKLVLENGIQELIDAVESGEVPVTRAAEIAKEEPDQQRIRLARPENIHISDDSYEWFTPEEYIKSARLVMGSIDTDPATCETANQIVQAQTIYTKENSGLTGDWTGNVWLNPPYNMPLIDQFVRKAIESYRNGNIQSVIVLVNNATDTGWFHALLDECLPVCFTRGRVKFWSSDGPNLGARQGQAIFYLGDNTEAFMMEFEKYGAVMRRMS